MLIGIIYIKLYAPWIHSLKEKRMELKSLIAKLRHKFNISVAEIEEQDTHQIMVIGIASVTGSTAQADSTIDHILNFIQSASEAEIIEVKRELY